MPTVSKLTPDQRDALRFIIQRWELTQHPPTAQEIGWHVVIDDITREWLDLGGLGLRLVRDLAAAGRLHVYSEAPLRYGVLKSIGGRPLELRLCYPWDGEEMRAIAELLGVEAKGRGWRGDVVSEVRVLASLARAQEGI